MVVQRFRSAGPMTLNNYTEAELAHLRSVTSNVGTQIKYIVWIQEVGEQGTPHLQIYAQAFTKLSVSAWHAQLGARIANIVATQNVDKAIEYCKGYQNGQIKPGSDLSSVEEYGSKPHSGKRTDLIEAADQVRKRPLIEIMQSGSEHETVIARHYAYFKELDHVCQQKRAFDLAKEQHNAYLATRIRLPWEHKLKEIVEQETDTRAIHWFYDPIGDIGKTVNAKDLYFNHNAYYVTGGKAVDIAYGYKYEPIVVINLVASVDSTTMEYLYKVLEEFKDGIFSSGKYSSCTKVFPIPLVIVFSNVTPDETKMKRGRMVVHHCSSLNNSYDYSPPVASERIESIIQTGFL